MHIFLIILHFIITPAPVAGSIYNISIQSADGKMINMADFKGKKILIAAISPDNLDGGQLDYLDSIQEAHPSMVVMAIPANDFGGQSNTAIVTKIKNKKDKKILVAALTPVKKNAAANQNALLQWLTHNEGNTHFEADVSTDEQFYIVSESGILYSVLEKGTSGKVLDSILSQADVTE